MRLIYLNSAAVHGSSLRCFFFKDTCIDARLKKAGLGYAQSQGLSILNNAFVFFPRADW